MSTFDCPACGAPLHVTERSNATMRCEYCQKSVIIPLELRSGRSEHLDDTFTPGADLGALVGQAAAFKEVLELIRAGQKIEAIKRYHQLTGSGLAAARDAVEKLERGEMISLTSVKTGTSLAASQPDTAQAVQRIHELVTSRNKIEAVKLYRQTFGLGLKESKEAVEAIEAEMRAASVTVMGAGQTLTVDGREIVRKTGQAAAWISSAVALALVLCLVAFVFLAIGVTDGPLAGLWSRLNPAAFAAETLAFGGEGTGAGLFTDARGIAVDNISGNIYVAEYSGGRVQVFDASGKFLTQWNAGSSKTYIPSMAADRNGRVYVVGDGKVYVVEGATGSLLGTIELSDTFSYLDGLAVTASGDLVVSSGDSFAWLNRQGEIVKSMEHSLAAVSDASGLENLAVDGVGTIYAIGTFSDAVFKFDSAGRFITRFGSDGDEPGQFRAPGPLAVDNQSRVYVSDTKGIQVFDSDGRYLAWISVQGYAFGLAFNDQNELFVVTNAQKVLKYTIRQ